jgi:hypothetical protein
MIDVVKTRNDAEIFITGFKVFDCFRRFMYSDLTSANLLGALGSTPPNGTIIIMHDDDDTYCKYDWANTYLGYCIHQDIQIASLVCGVLSIAFWMVAQLPFVQSVPPSLCVDSFSLSAKSSRTGKPEKQTPFHWYSWPTGYAGM